MSPQSGQLLLNEIAPRLYRTVPQRVPMLGSEDAQELCQDALAMAAAMLDRVESQRKKVTPGNIAFYTTQLLRSGRRSTGSSKVDAMASGTQLNGLSVVHSLDEPVTGEGEEALTLADILASDAEDPSIAAARKLDWEAFLESSDERQRVIICTLAEGGQLQEAAREYGASPSCFSSVKYGLAKQAEAFWGPGVLAQVMQESGWRDGIRAGRERQACRWERNASRDA
jgi:hypothetical protein